jgi:outer membrane protein assembly factor BamB
MLVVFVGAALWVGCNRQPTVPVTPFAGFRNDSLCFLTSATDPGHLHLQYIFEFGDGHSDTTRSCLSGETAYCPHTFSDTGVFGVRARARNERGALSGWSDPFNYCASQRPMAGDTSNGWGGEPGGWRLEHWATNRWRYFVLDVGDPDGDSVSVKFLWGDGRSTEWSSFTVGGRVADSVWFDTCGEYYIRLLLRDQRGTLAGPDTLVRLRVTEIAPLWMALDLESFDGCPSPALGRVNGELVLCGMADDGVWCFSTRGDEKWFFDTEDGADFGPVFSRDCRRIYVPGLTALHCLDAANGDALWSLPLPDEALSTPCIGPGGEIYLATADNELLMVRDMGDSAAVGWQVSAGGWSCGPAIATDGTVYIVTSPVNSGRLELLALRPDGTEIWRDTSHMLATCDQYPPVIDSRGRVLVPVQEPPALNCFNPDGTLAWQCGLPLFSCASLTVGVDDDVYLLDEDERLVCVDSNGNQVRATYIGTDGYPQSAPCVVSDGSVVAYDAESDWLCCVSKDGELLWQYSLWDSISPDVPRRPRRDDGDYDGSPLIGPDGNLYAVSWEFGVFSFALGDRTLAQTAWPTYNHDPTRSGWAGRLRP